MKIAFSPNSITISSDAFALHGGAPAASVRLGSQEQLLTVEPTGAPKRRVERVTSPLGPARRTTSRWVIPIPATHDRLVLSWSVTRLDRLPGLTLQCELYNGTGQELSLHDFTLLRAGTAANDAAVAPDAAAPDGGIVCQGDAAAWWLGTVGLSRRAGDLDDLSPRLGHP